MAIRGMKRGGAGRRYSDSELLRCNATLPKGSLAV